jgi:NAD+ synthetase
MAVSNRTGAIVLTTGNKSELAVGYCTLYGDMVGGLAVISDLPKTMVYDLSRWVNRDEERIPRSSIDKPPSAELRPDQKDEDSLPPYSVLDPILELFVERGLGKEEIIQQGFDRAVVSRVLHMVRANEYKRRQAAPGLIVTSKAFGPGRRMPIAQGFVEE